MYKKICHVDLSMIPHYNSDIESLADTACHEGLLRRILTAFEECIWIYNKFLSERCEAL
ncbi:hypothetical protein J2W91_000012 [Paenibacillus amylolyticus]|uniref:Uncharacterized protein n=1 Tax=Paenibacillus amylolyticus TaxID=1451 RepID=A0AAP5LNJ1_PAEAM|nr:hypothetical protein [Paenibacillus amylolyticus]